MDANELMNQLASDAEYQQRMRAAEAEREVRAAALRRAERLIVDELAASGINVGSVWDLVNTAEPNPGALPLLNRHFETGGYPEKVMESIGRALAVKPSVVYWERIRARYVDARCAGEETGAAVALAACATRTQFEDLLSLIKATGRGDSRLFFLQPIRKLGGDRGIAVLRSLLGDPVFGKEAKSRLGKLGRQ
jgi:hypothetical protein